MTGKEDTDHGQTKHKELIQHLKKVQRKKNQMKMHVSIMNHANPSHLINQLVDQSINWSINQSIGRSINQPINQCDTSRNAQLF